MLQRIVLVMHIAFYQNPTLKNLFKMLWDLLAVEFSWWLYDNIVKYSVSAKIPPILIQNSITIQYIFLTHFIKLINKSILLWNAVLSITQWEIWLWNTHLIHEILKFDMNQFFIMSIRFCFVRQLALIPMSFIFLIGASLIDVGFVQAFL